MRFLYAFFSYRFDQAFLFDQNLNFIPRTE